MTTNNDPTMDSATRDSDDEPVIAVRTIEQLSIATLLQVLIDRTAAIEGKVAAIDAPRSKASTALEFARIALGGWPAFGFLFLLLFYGPLRAALTAIPAKIQSASEIALAGVTLKSTITEVAVSQGVANIGKAIPELSGAALQLLLRAPRNGEGFISYSVAQDDRTITSFGLPSDEAVEALGELEDAGFVVLSGGMSGMEQLDVSGVKVLIAEIKNAFPGHLRNTTREWRVDWELDPPADRDIRKPDLIWRLTDTGAAAVKVVITAVSAELSRAQPAPTEGEQAR